MEYTANISGSASKETCFAKRLFSLEANKSISGKNLMWLKLSVLSHYSISIHLVQKKFRESLSALFSALLTCVSIRLLRRLFYNFCAKLPFLKIEATHQLSIFWDIFWKLLTNHCK